MTARTPISAQPRRRMPPQHLADLTASERRTVVTELGLPAFRAEQLSRHYFTRLERNVAQMSDIPAGARASLASALLPTLLTEMRQVVADHGATRKTLWRLFDGALVESVLMGYRDRVTVCVSSQA